MVIGTVMPVIHTTAGTGHMLDGTTDGTTDGTMDGTGNTQETYTVHGMPNMDGAELNLTAEHTAVGVMDIAVDALKMALNQLAIAQAFSSFIERK
jgi:hypothetical protein